MKITAAVMTKADGMLTRRRIRLEQVQLDDPRDNEVLVRISSCGICGTDRGAIHGLEPYPTPGVLGHEGCGIVEAVGREVTAWKPGDRVMIGFAYCGYCRSCRRGQHRYCENGARLNFSGYRMDGTGGMKRKGGEEVAGRFFQQSSWATHALAVENQLARVPDGLDLDTTGPYGCSISTGAGTILNELRPAPGSSLAVFGTGNVGLAAIMAAQLSGVTRIIAVDKDKKRLALARELGATDALVHGADTVAEIREMVGDRLDYSVEATDGKNLVSEAVAALGILGTCAMVGGAAATEFVKVKHPDFLLKGKRLIGVVGGGGQTPMFLEGLMDLQLQGRFPVEKLMTSYDFADINRAIDDSDEGRTIKPILKMGG